MKKPAISIIVPTYNDEPYLRQALDSAAAQTLREIEIICVNDGSTDGTAAILSEYAARDGRFRVINNGKNRGSLFSRKAGVGAARGEYCLFLDSDDELAPSCAETVYALIRQHEVDIVEFSYQVRLYRDDGTVADLPVSAPRECGRTENVMEHLIFHSAYGHCVWDKFYRTELLKTAFGAINEEFRLLGEDYYHGFVIEYYAKSLYAADTPPLYRYHAGRGVCKTGAISMDYFQARCRMIEISRYIQSFLERENAWDERRRYWQAVTDRMISECCQDYLLRLPEGNLATAIDLVLQAWDGLLSERGLALLLSSRGKELLGWAGELERSKEWYLEQLSCKDARKLARNNGEALVLPQSEGEAQKMLYEIYNMRSWKLIQRYRRFMDETWLGSVIRKIRDQLRR